MKKLILLLILALCPVYSWAACTGTNYGDDTDDFSPDSQVHYIGDVNYYLGKPTGLFDSFASTHYTPAYQLQLVATGGAIASKSQLSFSDPVATVSAKDKRGPSLFHNCTSAAPPASS